MASIPSPPPDAISETIEEGPGRYVPFLARLRTALTAGARFTAYTSEAGEALRPIVSPSLVKGAYAISWSYIIGDVAYAGYRANQQSDNLLMSGGLANSIGIATGNSSQTYDNLTPAQKVELKKREFYEGKMLEKVGNSIMGNGNDNDHNDRKSNVIDPRIHGKYTHVGFVMARRAVFQSIASMALPAFTVHTVVRYSAPLFKNSKPKVKRFGPTFLGLATIPALPFMFDEPVEHVIDWLFDSVEGFLFSGSMPSIADAKEEIKGGYRDAKESLKDEIEDLKTSASASSSSVTEELEKKKNQMENSLEKSKWKISDLFSKSENSIQSSKEEIQSKIDDLKSNASKALILGVGVDLLYLPRLKSLINRQSGRMMNRISRVGVNASTLGDGSSKAAAIALDRFARRILSKRESQDWKTLEKNQKFNWLAVRWTSKEALYKSLYPNHRLSFKDISIFKIEDCPKPILSFSEEWFERNKLQQTARTGLRNGQGSVAVEDRDDDQGGNQKNQNQNQNGNQDENRNPSSLPNFHLSISHDGDYVIAYVIAEQL